MGDAIPRPRGNFSPNSLKVAPGSDFFISRPAYAVTVEKRNDGCNTFKREMFVSILISMTYSRIHTLTIVSLLFTSEASVLSCLATWHAFVAASIVCFEISEN